jgi:hypothetical protein
MHWPIEFFRRFVTVLIRPIGPRNNGTMPRDSNGQSSAAYIAALLAHEHRDTSRRQCWRALPKQLPHGFEFRLARYGTPAENEHLIRMRPKTTNEILRQRAAVDYDVEPRIAGALNEADVIHAVAFNWRLTCSSAAARRGIMRAASAQSQRGARGAHVMLCHRPLQLRVMRTHSASAVAYHFRTGLSMRFAPPFLMKAR